MSPKKLDSISIHISFQFSTDDPSFIDPMTVPQKSCADFSPFSKCVVVLKGSGPVNDTENVSIKYLTTFGVDYDFLDLEYTLLQSSSYRAPNKITATNQNSVMEVTASIEIFCP